jgi:hypothetical protein
MEVCTDKQAVADAFVDLLSLSGDRITKSYNLSSESLPYSELVEYMSMSKDEAYRNAAKVMTRLYNTKSGTESKTSIIDMCTIASTEDVINGKVRLFLPGYLNSTPIYYDATLYIIHLKHILYLLNTNPNYHFYPLDAKDFGEYTDDYWPVSVVDGQSLLISSEQVVLHFVQHDIIRTLYEDLYNQALVRQKYFHSREEIISLITNKIESISKSVG